jgi:hypothetical protein
LWRLYDYILLKVTFFLSLYLIFVFWYAAFVMLLSDVEDCGIDIFRSF